MRISVFMGVLVALGVGLVLLARCSGQGGPEEPGWGAEFVLKIHNRPADSKAAHRMIQGAITVIERRLSLKGFTFARVSAVDAEKLRVRIPGADPANIVMAARGMLGRDTLEIFEVADASVQEAFSRTKRFLEGYRALENRASVKRQDLPEYRPWDVDTILVKHTPVVEGSSITGAWVERSAGGTPEDSWQTAFRVSREGAKWLDGAAARLSNQRPPGLMAIVMTRRLMAVVRVTTVSIGREARITGSDSEEHARELAFVLMSGSLEADLGFSGDIVRPEEKPLEFFYYGTRGSTAPQLQKLR